MKYETRREHAMRLKRQRRSAIMGLVLAFLLVIVIGVVMYINKASLQKQYDINEQTKADLQAQLEEQQQRTKDLEEYKKYIQTKKFVEVMNNLKANKALLRRWQRTSLDLYIRMNLYLDQKISKLL